MPKILVAYATKHNATAEIAEVIGQTLQQSKGLQVDVRLAEEVRDLTPYDAVVVGSAVYAGQWQRGAADFLKRFEAELAKRPTWIFSSGPTGEGDPKVTLKGWDFPEALRPIADRIKPREVMVFHGKLDPEQLGFFEKSIVKLVHAPVGDFRDWDSIRAWASDIAEVLQAEEIG